MPTLLGNVLLFQDHVITKINSRFVEAFHLTWFRLPAKDQRSMYNYLRRFPGRVFLCFSMNHDNPPVEPWGRVLWYERLTVFTFLAALVEGADSIEAICSVIAHELAHCFRRSRSLWTPDKDIEEIGAREVTKTWGFQEPIPHDRESWNTEIDRWRSDYRRIYGKYTETYFIKSIFEGQR
jgi:hypothetical protein